MHADFPDMKEDNGEKKVLMLGQTGMLAVPLWKLLSTQRAFAGDVYDSTYLAVIMIIIFKVLCSGSASLKSTSIKTFTWSGVLSYICFTALFSRH